MIQKLHHHALPLTVAEKLNELIDAYNNHLHEVSSPEGKYPLDKTGLPVDIGSRNTTLG